MLGPWGKDVAGISWESLRLLARQIEVERGGEGPEPKAIEWWVNS